MTDVVGSAKIEIEPGSTAQFETLLSRDVNAALDKIIGKLSEVEKEIGVATLEGEKMVATLSKPIDVKLQMDTAAAQTEVSKVSGVTNKLEQDIHRSSGNGQAEFRDLARAGKGVGETLEASTGSIATGFSNIGVATQDLLSKLGPIGVAIGGIALAGTAVAAGLGFAGEKAESYGQSLYKLQTLTGDSTESLAGLNVGAHEAGIPVDALGTAVARFQKNIGTGNVDGFNQNLALQAQGSKEAKAAQDQLADATQHLKDVQLLQSESPVAKTTEEQTRRTIELRDANDAVADAQDKLNTAVGLSSAQLDKLGITTRDANGQVLPFNDLLGNVADHFKGMTDENARTTLAMQLFGRSGYQLLPLLIQGREGLANYTEEADKFGLALDQNATDKAHQAYLAQKELGVAWEGLQVTIGVYVLPALQAVAGFLSDQIKSAIDAVAPAVDLLSEGWHSLGDALDSIKPYFDGFLGDTIKWGAIGIAIGLVTAALVALGDVVVGVIISAAAAAAPFVAVGLAIGALVGGLVAAYQDFDTFRNIVDDVAGFLHDTFLSALQGVQDLWAVIWPGLVSGAQQVADIWDTSIRPAVDELWTSLQGLFTAAQPILGWLVDHWQILGAVFVTLVSGGIAPLVAAVVQLYQNWEPFRTVIDAVVTGLGKFASILIDNVGGAIRETIGVVTGLVDILTGLLSFDWDKISAGATKVFDAVRDRLVGVASAIVDGWEQFGSNVLPALQRGFSQVGAWIVSTGGPILGGALKTFATNIPQWLGDLAAIFVDIFENAMSALGADVFSNVPGWVGQLLSNLPQWLGDLGAILTDIFENALHGLGVLFSNVPQWLGDIGALLGPALSAGFEAAFRGLGTLLSNIPQWLGDIGAILTDWLENGLSGLGHLLSNLPQWLGNVGAILVGWLHAGWDYVSTHWQEIIYAAARGALAIPGLLFQAIKSLDTTIFGWLKDAWDFVASHWQDILSAFMQGVLAIPGLIRDGLFALGGFLVDAVKAAWGWVVQNGPGILEAVAGWVQSLPSTIVGWLVNLGSFLFDAVKAGWQWVVDKGPDILETLGTWVESIPGKIVDGLFTLGSDLVGWIGSAWQWVVDHGPDILKSFGDFITGIPGKIKDWLGDVTQTLFTAGGDIINGLWNGLKSTIGKIIDGMSAVLDPIKQAFKDAFGISSPAKEMIPIGENIGEGVRVGLMNSMSTLGDSIQQQADLALSSYHPSNSQALDDMLRNLTPGSKVGGLTVGGDVFTDASGKGVADIADPTTWPPSVLQALGVADAGRKDARGDEIYALASELHGLVASPAAGSLLGSPTGAGSAGLASGLSGGRPGLHGGFVNNGTVHFEVPPPADSEEPEEWSKRALGSVRSWVGSA